MRLWGLRLHTGKCWVAAALMRTVLMLDGAIIRQKQDSGRTDRMASETE